MSTIYYNFVGKVDKIASTLFYKFFGKKVEGFHILKIPSSMLLHT